MKKTAHIAGTEHSVDIHKLLEENDNAIEASGAVIMRIKEEVKELKRKNREIERKISLLL